MYNLSRIIGKQAVMLSGAQILGTVTDVLLSAGMRRLDCLLLTDDEEEDDAYLLLPARSIGSMKYDAVAIRSLTLPLKRFYLAGNNPINTPCYNQDGKKLGAVTDIVFDDKLYVSAFEVGDKQFEPKRLLSLSPALCVFNDGEQPVKLTRPRTKKPAPRLTPPAAVNALPENLPQLSCDIATPPVSSAPPPDLGVPDFSFLIGKHADRDLLSKSGAVIIRSGEEITPQTVETAAKANRLVHLTLRAF